MKLTKQLFLLLISLLTLIISPQQLHAAIQVTIDNTPVAFANNINPENISDRVLVPARGVFEALDFDVAWSGELQQVTLTRVDHEIVFTIGQTTFLVNGSPYQLEVAAQILHGGTTFLPLRHPLESIGYTLAWDASTHTVLISTNESTPSLAWVHGFYAFGSFAQRALIHDMDSVSFGWSVMQWDEQNGARLNTTAVGGNEWHIPSGYELIANYPRQHGARTHLNVFMDTLVGLNELLADEQARTQAIRAITNELERIYPGIGRSPFDGVTINFEGLRGAAAREQFSAFLIGLSAELRANDMTLYVTVHPTTIDGVYFGGYDFRLIGQLADRVILMTHDYHPRRIPEELLGTEWQRHAALAPIAEVRRSLESITHPLTGVEDPSKIAIAFSFQNVGWRVDENNRVISPTPVTVSMDTVITRMAQPDTIFGWSQTHQNPYIIYTTEAGERIFLWYQDSRSVDAKIRLANSFGIHGASVWRLGIVPNSAGWDVWGSFAR